MMNKLKVALIGDYLAPILLDRQLSQLEAKENIQIDITRNYAEADIFLDVAETPLKEVELETLLEEIIEKHKDLPSELISKEKFKKEKFRKTRGKHKGRTKGAFGGKKKA